MAVFSTDAKPLLENPLPQQISREGWIQIRIDIVWSRSMKEKNFIPFPKRQPELGFSRDEIHIKFFVEYVFNLSSAASG